MRKAHLELKEQEHSYLTTLTTAGELKARKYKRVMTLLWLHQGKTMSEVSHLLDYAYPSVIALKKNYLERSLECLEERPRAGRPIGFSGEERAKITALACSRVRPAYSALVLCTLMYSLPIVSHTQIRPTSLRGHLTMTFALAGISLRRVKSLDER